MFFIQEVVILSSLVAMMKYSTNVTEPVGLQTRDSVVRSHRKRPNSVDSRYYVSRNGYKMCIRAYLNGDGSGYKTHLSLFFVLMKGEYDALLRWPFDYKVSMILVGKEWTRSDRLVSHTPLNLVVS